MVERELAIREARLTWALLSFLVFGPGYGTPSWAAPSVPGQWVSIGPSRITAPPTQGFGQYDAVGRLTTIAVDPSNPQTIYTGSAGQLGHEGSGVWKTTDGGHTWMPISDSLPTLSVGAIAIDPTNTNRVYIVTADEGLYRSDDAGLTWNHLHGDLHIRTNTNDGDRTVLLINPLDPNVLYVTSDLGVQRSGDGGQTWSVSLSVGSATSLVMDPLTPNILYAAILGQGIYKTVTGGSTGNGSWIPQTQSPLPFGNVPMTNVLLAITHATSAAPEIVYALFPASQGYDLFRTTDGNLWSKQYSCANCFFVILATDPSDGNNVYLGGPLFWVSSNGGVNFTQVPAAQNDRQPASPHGDYWELVTDPSNAAILFVGSDGGIYCSSDHGKEGTWAFIGEGITNAEMYSLALADTLVSRAISGTQDNGNILYNGSLVWDHIPPDQIEGGDGGGVALDPTDGDLFYAVFDNRGTPSQSVNAGQAFVGFNSGIPSGTSGSCAIWNMTFYMQVHPTDPQTLLLSCNSLWETTTNAAPGNWNPIFTPPTGQRVIHSAVDSNLDIYYAGTDQGRLFAGPSGANWQEIFANADSSLYVSDIEVDGTNPGTVYASFAPFTTVDRDCPGKAGTQRVYQLKLSLPNPPSLSVTAKDITQNLPAGLCVNALAIDPHISRTVYAATNKGVYRGRSNASGGPWVWEAYNDGMPPADVRDLEVHPGTGHIFAATFGRSAFEVIPETILPVSIDIKPGGSPNSINRKSHGKIPVAILSSLTFDASSEVNKNSLTFGQTGDEASLAFCNGTPEDVNGDGLADLVCHFSTVLTGFGNADSVGVLKGLTVEGVPIEGHDSVRILH